MTFYPFAELVNIEELQLLCEQFTRLTGFGTAILDMEGNVLTATGWQEICTRFHRSTPESACRCLASDTVLASRLQEGEKFCMYRCGNGLIDVAVPLVIDGRQVGRLFSGQFLLAPPDMEFFRQQAAEFGFDEAAYLNAVRKVQVVTEERVHLVMGFLCRLAEIIGESGLANKRAENTGLIAEESPAVLFRWKGSEGWPVVYVSQNITQFGYTPEQLMSGDSNFSTLVHPEDLQRIILEIERNTSRGIDRFQVEHRIITRAGTVRWVTTRTVLERDADGMVTNYRGVVLDITEHKQAEEALRFTQFAVDHSSSQAFWTTPEGHIFYVNEAACRTLGYSREELVGMTISDIGPTFPPEVFAEHWQDLRQKGSITFETVHRAKDGRVYPVEINANLVVFDNKKYNCAFATDISERKRIEESLQVSLAEKTVLLQELHHRVKNNLQIISTLLDIQSDAIADVQVKSYFRECQNRINSLALVHEQLYQSCDLASVDLAEYISRLATYLFSSFVKDPARIALELDTESVSLNIDQTIPCGLIVNELISNSLKHAFPDNRAGTISVRLKVAAEGWITFTVADNGIGLPADLESRKTHSLGLQLVHMLVRQLQGELEIHNDGGTSFVVRLKRRGKKQGL
ncbi:MAG: PocR ligand-binding domain-containing protein [Geobacteraceae bacterium]|nr:PocR ligand-binding domain-containing protein [Geobacteraceae bacterium]